MKQTVLAMFMQQSHSHFTFNDNRLFGFLRDGFEVTGTSIIRIKTVSPPTQPVIGPVRYINRVQEVFAGIGGSVGRRRTFDSSSCEL